MHQWKVPLEYRAMLLFPCGRWGKREWRTPWSGGDTYEVVGKKIYEHMQIKIT